MNLNNSAMGFGRANVFHIENRITERTSQSTGLMIGVVLQEAL
jgi:hypothetical protein